MQCPKSVATHREIHLSTFNLVQPCSGVICHHNQHEREIYRYDDIDNACECSVSHNVFCMCFYYSSIESRSLKATSPLWLIKSLISKDKTSPSVWPFKHSPLISMCGCPIIPSYTTSIQIVDLLIVQSLVGWSIHPTTKNHPLSSAGTRHCIDYIIPSSPVLNSHESPSYPQWNGYGSKPWSPTPKAAGEWENHRLRPGFDAGQKSQGSLGFRNLVPPPCQVFRHLEAAPDDHQNRSISTWPSEIEATNLWKKCRSAFIS